MIRQVQINQIKVHSDAGLYLPRMSRSAGHFQRQARPASNVDMTAVCLVLHSILYVLHIY